VPRNFDGQENNTHTRPFRPHPREERARFESKGYSSTNDRKRKRSTDSSHERLSHADDMFQDVATESNDRKKIKRQPCLDFRNKNNRCPLLNDIYNLSFSHSDLAIILSKLSDLQKKEQHNASYFSECLQHLFYYLPHTLTAAHALAEHKAYVRNLLAEILEKFGDSLFIMNNFWVDPKEGYTVLMGSVSACEQDDQKLSMDLLERIKMDCRHDPKALRELIQIKSTNAGFSVLILACRHGLTNLVSALLETAKDKLPRNEFRSLLTNPDKFGFTPLNTSCKAGHLQIVQTLLKVAKRKLSPEEFRSFLTNQDKFRFSPLNTSCKEGHPEIVKCLVHAWLELDEDFNEQAFEQAFRKFLEQKNRHGFTPLNAAAKAASELACSVDNNRKRDYTDVLTYLLALDANPDIPNDRGYTARQNFPSYDSWPPRLRKNAEDSEKNELKPYLSSVSRHEKSWFFRPVPYHRSRHTAKPFHSIGHHHTIRHHHRSRHTTMRTHRW